MKGKLSQLFALIAVCVLVSGCASAYPLGTVYTAVTFPVSATTGDITYSKIGTATSNSYIALIAIGDSSIEAAARNGGITKIKLVDYKVNNIFGLIGVYTTTVYGD